MRSCVCVCVCVCEKGSVNQTAFGVVSQLLHKQRHRKQEFREFKSSMWLHVRNILNYPQQANLSRKLVSRTCLANLSRLEICCDWQTMRNQFSSDFFDRTWSMHSQSSTRLSSHLHQPSGNTWISFPTLTFTSVLLLI